MNNLNVQIVFMAFLGGGIGSVLRLVMSNLFNTASGFPFGTFLANAIASIALAYFTFRFVHEDMYRIFLMVGLCGGLSTFSTFSAESIKMVQEGKYILFFIYVFSSISVCLIGFAGTYFLCKGKI